MALGDILGGLGMGLGAGAQGYLGGQIKGEAELYRRGRLEEDRELKKALLAQKRKELDPRKPMVDTARTMLQGLTLESFKPEFQQYRLRYPDFDKRYAGAQAHLGNVINGTEDLDVSKLAWFTTLSPTGAAGGLGAGPAPAEGAATPPAPPPPGAPPTGPLAGLLAEAAPQPGIGMTAPSGTLGSRALGAMPSAVASLMESRRAPAPAAAAAPAAPAEPETPTRESVLREIAQVKAQKPRPIEPGEHPGDYDKYLKDFRNQQRQEIQALASLSTAIPRGRETEVRTDELPKEGVSKRAARTAGIGRAEAGTEESRERVRVSKITAPLTAAQKQAQTARTKVETGLAPRRVAAQERAVTSGERQAAAAEGRLVLSRDEFDEMKRRAKLSITEKAVSKADAEDQKTISQGLRAITATKRSASGADTFTLKPADREAWQKRIDDALARRDARRTGGASTSTTTTTTFSGRPDQRAALGGGETLQTPLTKPELANVKSALAAGPDAFKAWVNGLSPNVQKRVRFAERELKRKRK